MALLFTPVKQRIAALLTTGYKAGLSPTGDARLVPANRFRMNATGAPLRDRLLDSGACDRVADVKILKSHDTPGKNNQVNKPQWRDVWFALTVGYVYGSTQAAGLWLWPSEDPTYALANPDDRGLSDAEQIKLALEWYEFWTADPTDPKIWKILREGDSTWTDLGNGRSVVESTYYVGVQFTAGTAYQPP